MSYTGKLIITAIVTIMLLALGFAIINNAAINYHQSKETIQKSQWVSATESGGIELVTVNHDGHLFVILNDYRPQVIHHPSCVCLED